MFVLVTVLAVGAVMAFGRGELTIYDGRGLSPAEQRAEAPPWSAACLRFNRRRASKTDRVCGRVRGRILYAEKDDPDQDGDVHFVMMSEFRLVLVEVKNAARQPVIPKPGPLITVTGPITSGYYGDRQMLALRLER
jgi:hypothetical protein